MTATEARLEQRQARGATRRLAPDACYRGSDRRGDDVVAARTGFPGVEGRAAVAALLLGHAPAIGTDNQR